MLSSEVFQLSYRDRHCGEEGIWMDLYCVNFYLCGINIYILYSNNMPVYDTKPAASSNNDAHQSHS